eukprot:s92_g10.t1
MEATKIDQASCKICRLGWNGRKRPLEAKLKAQQLPDVKAPASDSATPCEVCEKRLEVFRKVTALSAADFSSVLSEEVTSVGYSSELKHLAWHPEVAARDASVAYQVGAGRSRWLQAEDPGSQVDSSQDEIAVPWSQLMPLVDQLQDSFSILPADNVVFIGLGTGAHLATALAYSLIEKRVPPNGVAFQWCSTGRCPGDDPHPLPDLPGVCGWATLAPGDSDLWRLQATALPGVIIADGSDCRGFVEAESIGPKGCLLQHRAMASGVRGSRHETEDVSVIVCLGSLDR